MAGGERAASVIPLLTGESDPIRTRPASFEGEVMKQVNDCGAVARAESTRWGMRNPR